MRTLLIVFLMLCSHISFAHAQSAESVDFFEHVRITDISLHKEIYKEGDTVMGTIVVTNFSPEDVDHIYADVTLVSGSEPGTEFYRHVYDFSALHGPHTLSASSTFSIPISYTLPKGIAGNDPGLVIALKRGEQLDIIYHQTVPIIISGESVPQVFPIGEQLLIISDENYALGTNPIVFPTDEIKLSLHIETAESDDVILNGIVRVDSNFTRSSSTKVFESSSDYLITSSADDITEIPISIEMLDSGLHYGSLQFFDTKGAMRSPIISFDFNHEKQPFSLSMTPIIRHPFSLFTSQKNIIRHTIVPHESFQNQQVNRIEDITLFTTVQDAFGNGVAYFSKQVNLTGEQVIEFEFETPTLLQGYTIESVIKTYDRSVAIATFTNESISVSPLLKYIHIIFFSVTFLLLGYILLRIFAFRKTV